MGPAICPLVGCLIEPFNSDQNPAAAYYAQNNGKTKSGAVLGGFWGYWKPLWCCAADPLLGAYNKIRSAAPD